jgi:hypothetical protein
MAWMIESFLKDVLVNLNEQGYRIDALADPRPLGGEGGAWRVTLHSPEEAMPGSIILKQADSQRPWRWNDWACQYFLTDMPGTKGLGPEFFAGDEGLGFYVMEDLGLGQDLGSAMVQNDSRGHLAASLLACGLASLHAGTWGRERTYGLLRSRLPGQQPSRRDELTRWRAQVDEFLIERQLDPLAYRAALDAVQFELNEGHEFLALTHGDWDAKSVWYGDAGPRFLDFRGGAFRHALLDLAAWELPFGGNEAVAEVLWREYRDEWARLGADRGERFMEALAHARAFMALKHLMKGGMTPDVKRMLGQAAQEPGLEILGDLAGN